ncbi:probable serine hydrolase [Condylostylus longicornis]|uniref:probable serine hydrolase n=1 Tax=Condylostylus longicornis TaxID=2530218 RepID=UPI00244DE1D0|nr:probable serine hydrolase [Condylostylus longicornis]
MVTSSRNIKINEREEIKIDVPWGHLSGIWYGSKLNKPLLALHGWQDNASTFDTLTPLLPSNVSVLAIEFPGHGFSSPIPAGMCYRSVDFIFTIKFVMNAYKWKTIALIGHSLGSQVAFYFAALFPEKVEFLILLDAFQTKLNLINNSIDIMRFQAEKFWTLYLKNDSHKEPPSYTYEECVDKLHEGTYKSVTKDCAKYLLNRNLKKSELFPNKYYFIRDGRLKYNEMFNYSEDVGKEMARRITSPFLLLKAHDEGTSYHEEKKFIYGAVELLRKSNSDFSFNIVSGTHHVHLCEPEKVAKIVNPFLDKYYSRYSQWIKNKL